MPRETVSGFMSAGSNGFSWLIYLNQAGHECRERWVHMQMFWGVHRISPSEHHNRAGFTPSRAALKEDRSAFEDSRGRVKKPKFRGRARQSIRGARGEVGYKMVVWNFPSPQAARRIMQRLCWTGCRSALQSHFLRKVGFFDGSYVWEFVLDEFYGIDNMCLGISGLWYVTRGSAAPQSPCQSLYYMEQQP